MTGLRRLALAALPALMLAPFRAPAAEVSIIGRWEIVEAAAAPWTKADEQAALAAEAKRMLHLAITFRTQEVSSNNKLFTCKRGVVYESNELEVDSIFEGNLPEPNPAATAARMGFAKGTIPGVDVKCFNAQFSFHFRDPNTALINLNSVIYTLKRR